MKSTAAYVPNCDAVSSPICANDNADSADNSINAPAFCILHSRSAVGAQTRAR